MAKQSELIILSLSLLPSSPFAGRLEADNPFLYSNSMSAQNQLSFPSEHSLSDHNHRPYLHPPTHDQYNNPEEFKASYDDLIDEYSKPYATNTHHRTYTIDPDPNTPPNHHRGPSIPLSSSKSPFSAKQSDDTHETAQIVYPPQPLPKQPDAPGFWQKVSWPCCSGLFLVHEHILDPPRLDGVSSLRSCRPCRNDCQSGDRRRFVFTDSRFFQG